MCPAAELGGGFGRSLVRGAGGRAEEAAVAPLALALASTGSCCLPHTCASASSSSSSRSSGSACQQFYPREAPVRDFPARPLARPVQQQFWIDERTCVSEVNVRVRGQCPRRAAVMTSSSWAQRREGQAKACLAAHALPRRHACMLYQVTTLLLHSTQALNLRLRTCFSLYRVAATAHEAASTHACNHTLHTHTPEPCAT